MRERKSIDELKRERDGDDADSDDESEDVDTIEFAALDDDEQREINELFTLLNERGYLTAGPYQIQADEQRNKSVTLTAVLPSALDQSEARDGE